MIVVAGAAHLDRLGHTDGPAITDTSNPGSFNNTLGGAALNVASLLAALGQDVLVISCVGDDAVGRDVIAGLKARGAATQIATLSDQHSATYTAVVNNTGDLVIALADMKCYDHFDPSFAKEGLAKLSTSDWLLVDANFPSTALEAMVDTVDCNIAAMTVSSAKAKRIHPILNKIDILFTNRAEAVALTGLSDAASNDDIMTEFKNIGLPAAVMTNGANSLLLWDGSRCEEISIPPAQITDVTGAGDGMVAGCLNDLMAEKGLNEAVKTGISAAQAVLQVSGPYLPDIKSIIADSKDN